MAAKIFQESGLTFDFSKSVEAVIADNPGYNGLSAVDFIVEISDGFLFILEYGMFDTAQKRWLFDRINSLMPTFKEDKFKSIK